MPATQYGQCRCGCRSANAATRTDARQGVKPHKLIGWPGGWARQRQTFPDIARSRGRVLAARTRCAARRFGFGSGWARRAAVSAGKHQHAPSVRPVSPNSVTRCSPLSCVRRAACAHAACRATTCARRNGGRAPAHSREHSPHTPCSARGEDPTPCPCEPAADETQWCPRSYC